MRLLLCSSSAGWSSWPPPATRLHRKQGEALGDRPAPHLGTLSPSSSRLRAPGLRRRRLRAPLGPSHPATPLGLLPRLLPPCWKRRPQRKSQRRTFYWTASWRMMRASPGKEHQKGKKSYVSFQPNTWGVLPRTWLSSKPGYVNLELVVNHLLE